VGIRETLQDALTNANNERLKWHDTIQNHDRELVNLRANLQRAETKKAGADSFHKAADAKYRELLAYSNNLADQDAKRALTPEIETLAQNVNLTVRNVQEAGEEARSRQRNVIQIEARRASAQTNLQAATERWDQIRKQIEDLNR